LPLLDGQEYRAERHRLKKMLRDSRQEYEKVVAAHGSSFRRGWSNESLYARALRLGLENFYEYYKLASAVLHGSAGGQIGTVATVNGMTVRRVGFALQLLPSAYCEGVRAFRHIVQGIAAIGLDTDTLDEGLQELLRGWPYYRRAVNKVDRWLWPKRPPGVPMAVLAVARSGKRRWYHFDPELELIIEAEPPANGQIPELTEARIEKLLEQDFESHMLDSDEWLTMMIEDVMLNAKKGARWLPAAGILIPPKSGRILSEPIRLDI
jgi:hypothetical protein